MNLEYPEKCLVCLGSVTQQNTDSRINENPSSSSTKGSCEVQTFEQLCQYLRVDFPVQSLKFKNVSRILTDDSKNSCESLLCSDCLEMVDELGWMYNDLKRVQRKIDIAIKAIQRVIETSERSSTTTDNGATGSENDALLVSMNDGFYDNDSGNEQHIPKKRKVELSAISLSSSVGKDYLKFVETFRKLVKEIVIQEPKPLVISEEIQTMANMYETMIEGSDDQEDEHNFLTNDNPSNVLGTESKNDEPVIVVSNNAVDVGANTAGREKKAYIGNSIEVTITQEDEKEEHAKSFEVKTKSVPNQIRNNGISGPSCYISSFSSTPKSTNQSQSLDKSKTIYECRYCKEIFESALFYFIHRKEYHPKESEALIIPTIESSNSEHGSETRSISAVFNICPLCGEQKGQNKNSLLQFMEHMLSHELVVDPVTTVAGDISLPDEEKSYRCNHCDQRFFLEMNLDLHKICYHESSLIKLECEECGDTSSTSWEDLMAHLVHAHNSQNIYSCKSCSMACTTADKMLKHMQVHVLSKRLPCPECDSVAPTLKNLYQHFNESHSSLLSRLQCHVCNETFLMPSTFQKHLNLCHSVATTTNNTTSVSFPKLGTVDMPSVAAEGNNSQNVQCPHCIDQRIFKNATTLDNHIRIHHDITVQKHECEQCGKAFVHRSTLRYHIQQIHLGIRYSCPFCPKSYTAKSLLKGHLKLHNGEGPPVLTCSICDNKFSSMSAFKTHNITQHEHNDPTSCDICGREFLNTFSLRAHKSDMHNFKHFACAHCPLKFARLKQFEKHFSTHYS